MEAWVEDLRRELEDVADYSPIVYGVLESVRDQSHAGRMMSERDALLRMVRELHRWGMTVERVAREALECKATPIVVKVK